VKEVDAFSASRLQPSILPDGSRKP